MSSAEVEEPPSDDDSIAAAEPPTRTGRLRERIAAMSDEEKREFVGAGGFKSISNINTGMGDGVAKSIGVSKVLEGITKPLADIGRLAKGLDFGTVKIAQPIKVPDPIDYGIDLAAESRRMVESIASIDPTTMPPARTAAAAEKTAEYTRDLLDAMRQSVVLSEQTRRDNAQMAGFTRVVGWFSIIGTAGSILVAVASLVVAIVALSK